MSDIRYRMEVGSYQFSGAFHEIADLVFAIIDGAATFLDALLNYYAHDS